MAEKSRLSIQRMTGTSIYLELSVRMQKKWSADDARLTEFGLP